MATIYGSFTAEGNLGAGPVGRVYQGRRMDTNTPVALKVINEDVTRIPGFPDRFRHIFQVGYALQHPNLLPIEYFGEQDGRYYVAMELAPDGSLRSMVKRYRALPLSFCVEVIRQAATALEMAHGSQYVHGDIKPDNVLLFLGTGALSVAKLSDFGVVRLARGSFADGTWAYMSPEQCTGVDIDGRSDIYSLGIVLYEITTGFPPFHASDRDDAANKHLYDAPVPPRRMRADIPQDLEDVILQCLAKTPAERFQAAASLASALKRVALGLGPVVNPEEHGPIVNPVQPAESVTSPPMESSSTQSPAVSGWPTIRIMDKSGRELKVVELACDTLAFGRSKETNNIVLGDDTVSKRHFTVSWDGSDVTVTDLGSRNGTKLGGRPLPANSPVRWPSGETLQVGPFAMALTLPAPSRAARPPREAPPQARPPLGQQPPPRPGPAQPAPPAQAKPKASPASERLQLTIDPDTRALRIVPGQPVPVRLTVTNTGSTVDNVAVMMEGVPAGWVQRPSNELMLNPGDSAPAVLSVNVPRSPKDRAGTYAVTIRARSVQNRDESVTVTDNWTLLPYIDGRMELDPVKRAGRTNAQYKVKLHNDGNAPMDCFLSAREDGQSAPEDGEPLDFQFENPMVRVEPGASIAVPLSVHAGNIWIGKAETRAFVVESASSARGDSPTQAPSQAVPGRFIHRALIPPWLPPVAAVILAILLVIGRYEYLQWMGEANLVVQNATTAVNQLQTSIKKWEAAKLKSGQDHAMELLQAQQAVGEARGEKERTDAEVSQANRALAKEEKALDEPTKVKPPAPPPDPSLSGAATQDVKADDIRIQAATERVRVATEQLKGARSSQIQANTAYQRAKEALKRVQLGEASLEEINARYEAQDKYEYANSMVEVAEGVVDPMFDARRQKRTVKTLRTRLEFMERNLGTKPQPGETP